jgi:hypothetical protein
LRGRIWAKNLFINFIWPLDTIYQWICNLMKNKVWFGTIFTLNLVKNATKSVFVDILHYVYSSDSLIFKNQQKYMKKISVGGKIVDFLVTKLFESGITIFSQYSGWTEISEVLPYFKFSKFFQASRMRSRNTQIDCFNPQGPRDLQRSTFLYDRNFTSEQFRRKFYCIPKRKFLFDQGCKFTDILYPGVK